MAVAEISEVAEARFDAMGTTAHVVVTGGSPALVDQARRRLADLEGRWSRFRPGSELSRLNRLAGSPVVVSRVTFDLIGRACEWWKATSGVFDPTVLHALIEAGYDRDFDELSQGGSIGVEAPARPAPGCAEIELVPLVGSVRLPPGVALDLGGIAKGFAADLVVDELIDDGARGACVNVGGDLRVMGESPAGGPWGVSIDPETPRSAAPPALALMEGAVATSSRTRRTWRQGVRSNHHLIDPRTGASARTAGVAATVVAGLAIDAEALAKAALLTADVNAAADLLVANHACGLLVDEAGAHVKLGDIHRFLAR